MTAEVWFGLLIFVVVLFVSLIRELKKRKGGMKNDQV
jgi:hypothetical protein